MKSAEFGSESMWRAQTQKEMQNGKAKRRWEARRGWAVRDMEARLGPARLCKSGFFFLIEIQFTYYKIHAFKVYNSRLRVL